MGGETDLVLGGEMNLLLGGEVELVLLPARGLLPDVLLAVAHPCEVFFAAGEVFLAIREATHGREVFLTP